MIWALLMAHAAVIALLPAVGRRESRHVFWLGALPPIATTAWALTQVRAATPATAEWVWVDGLDLIFRFRIDDLAALLTLLVSGIGALVFVYAGGYFGPSAEGTGRFAATLLAFSAAMVGLVWADTVWTLFVFWEATSITSFLLVGHKHTDADARLAARRALMITAGGGLVLLAGFVVFVDEAGTTSLTDMTPMSGSGAQVAAVLLMIAAATKSAQVPFHVWLPGAMAAPTPVSAYLHSATMVKAGVVLVAVASPALGEVSVWKPLGLAIGFTSMIWGAIGALRHSDAKLILAWGTVSQLGLMIGLLSLGEGKAVFAAVSLVFAHALFKAALFMLVGEIDVRAGTRDIRELSGLRASMPVTFWAAVLAGASMAGVPPLLGFTAKEAAIEAALGLSGTERVVVTALVVGGSVLTVAYTIRLLVGLFGRKGKPTNVASRRLAMTMPAAVLSAAGVVGFVAIDVVNDIVRPAAIEVESKAEVYSLLRWPGITTAFVTSVFVVIGGAMLGVVASRRTAAAPDALGARVADGVIDGVLVLARQITARVQHGSLPVYLLTMAAVAAIVAVPFFGAVDADAFELWASPAQGVLVVAVLAAAVGAATVRSRLGAALGLGGVGVGVSGLFVVHGAPDLALTQLLVETVVVVGFVIALGHLTRRFPPVGRTWRGIRIAVAGAVGLAVMAALAGSAAAPSGQPPLERLAEEAVDEGGGNNLVNVILTDVRALDTLGEIVVLMVVAVGILTLRGGRRSETAT